MEKQETEELDLSHWIIVHENPLLGWLGRLDDSYFEPAAYPDLQVNLLSQALTLHDVLVIQTTQMPMPAPGGQVQMGIVTSVMSPHSLTTESLLVTIMPTRITLVRTLSAADQRTLLLKIQGVRKAMVVQRALAAGIVIPGGRS